MVYEYIEEETLKLFEGCYAIDEKKTMGSQTGCWVHSGGFGFGSLR